MFNQVSEWKNWDSVKKNAIIAELFIQMVCEYCILHLIQGVLKLFKMGNPPLKIRSTPLTSHLPFLTDKVTILHFAFKHS